MRNLTSTATELPSAGTAAPPRSPAVPPALATRLVSPGTADAQQRAELHRELVQQFSPVGAIEQLLVAELARRANQMEQWSTAATSLRDVAAALGQSVLREAGFGLTADALLAATASSDAVEKADRASASHSRAFFRALRALLELQDRRAAAALPAAPERSHDFESEAQCVAYLADWQCRQFRCRHCGARSEISPREAVHPMCRLRSADGTTRRHGDGRFSTAPQNLVRRHPAPFGRSQYVGC